ncbi:MAG: hypothetical protein OEY79_00275 [Anaplasmataceae bacterium]|nr:hypothetical protein [Anaplasmataceae bacterium]
MTQINKPLPLAIEAEAIKQVELNGYPVYRDDDGNPIAVACSDHLPVRCQITVPNSGKKYTIRSWNINVQQVYDVKLKTYTTGPGIKKESRDEYLTRFNLILKDILASKDHFVAIQEGFELYHMVYDIEQGESHIDGLKTQLAALENKLQSMEEDGLKGSAEYTIKKNRRDFLKKRINVCNNLAFQEGDDESIRNKLLATIKSFKDEYKASSTDDIIENGGIDAMRNMLFCRNEVGTEVKVQRHIPDIRATDFRVTVEGDAIDLIVAHVGFGKDHEKILQSIKRDSETPLVICADSNAQKPDNLLEFEKKYEVKSISNDGIGSFHPSIIDFPTSLEDVKASLDEKGLPKLEQLKNVDFIWASPSLDPQHIELELMISMNDVGQTTLVKNSKANRDQLNALIENAKEKNELWKYPSIVVPWYTNGADELAMMKDKMEKKVESGKLSAEDVEKSRKDIEEYEKILSKPKEKLLQVASTIKDDPLYKSNEDLKFWVEEIEEQLEAALKAKKPLEFPKVHTTLLFSQIPGIKGLQILAPGYVMEVDYPVDYPEQLFQEGQVRN